MEGSEVHTARHGVTPSEVEQVLYGRLRYTTHGRDETRLVFGTSNAGRHLFVVVMEAANGRGFVDTARDMNHDEKRLFREKGQ